MVKLFKKLSGKLAVSVLNLLPVSAPQKALIASIEKKEPTPKKIVLDSVTVLDDDKALLTYKADKKYYTKKINYRRGEIKPIDIVVLGPYV